MTGRKFASKKSTCHFINKGRGTQTDRANTYTPRHRFKGGICRTVLARVEFMSLRHDFVWSEPAARLRQGFSKSHERTTKFSYRQLSHVEIEACLRTPTKQWVWFECLGVEVSCTRVSHVVVSPRPRSGIQKRGLFVFLFLIIPSKHRNVRSRERASSVSPSFRSIRVNPLTSHFVENLCSR